MGEILGVGCSHGPHLSLTDETMANIYFTLNLHSQRTPGQWKDPANWPEALRQEWGNDNAVSAARRHREELLKGYKAAREAIDAFNPDFVLVFGDAQYENFREDVLPPFCIYGVEEYDMTVRRGGGGGENRPVNPYAGKEMERPPMQPTVRGSKEIATYLADQLVNQGVDIACSWKLHHTAGLAHAFKNTVDFLDWERKGWPYTFIPFHVSCYGEDLRVPTAESEVVTGRIMEGVRVRPPIAPPAWRCYDVGKALARAIEASPYRAVIIGSSSWSHASLTDMHGYMWGDVDSDHEHYEQLKANKFHLWRDIDDAQMRASGQHEMRNWICLAGAMEGKKADVISYAETYIFNSSKAVALFT